MHKSIWYRGRGTYTAGTVNSSEKRRFSVPLLMTWCHQIDFPKSELNTQLYIFCCTGRQKCTKLHRCVPLFSKNFPGWHLRTPITGEGAFLSPDPCPSMRVHRPTFSELPRPLINRPRQQNCMPGAQIGKSDPGYFCTLWGIKNTKILLCITSANVDRFW